MKVTILGCGPAGLFAAHAAIGQGHDVTILSNPRKSFMRGAQYLHRPIPGLSGAPFQIDYQLRGSIEGYKDKVYGDMSDVQVSPETLVGIANAWDIREAYDAAWAEYGHLVRPFEVTPLTLDAIRADLIISTIPAKALCSNLDAPTEYSIDDPFQQPLCHFESQKVWSTNYLKDSGVHEDNIVICSGDPEDWWYRISRIHGWENSEFPASRKPYSNRVWEVEKPISTTCKCHPEVVRMGRYGAWKKGVLSDSAFYETEALLLNLNPIGSAAP